LSFIARDRRHAKGNVLMITKPDAAVDHSFSLSLGALRARAVREQEERLLHLASEIEVASRTLSVQDIEDKIRCSLEIAYQDAGVMPLWTDVYGVYGRSERATIASKDVIEFLENCIEGLLHGDSFWIEYSRRLFSTVEEVIDQ
jgi:hypothetical protein